MVTLEDVAVLAGVSRATVSRVVNGDTNVKSRTREKVEQAVAVLGYTPNPAARALASSQSNTLGLVTTSYRGGFFGALMDFVQTETESQGKQLLVTQGRDNADKEWLAIQRLYNLRCDGLILHVRFLSDERLHQLATAGRSFVLLDRMVPGLEARWGCGDGGDHPPPSPRMFSAQAPHQQLHGWLTLSERLMEASKARPAAEREGYIEAGLVAAFDELAARTGLALDKDDRALVDFDRKLNAQGLAHAASKSPS